MGLVGNDAIKNDNYNYFKTPLVVSGGTKNIEQLSGNITITVQAPNNTTGASSIIKLGDYLQQDFIQQFYTAEITIMSSLILFIGILKIIKGGR